MARRFRGYLPVAIDVETGGFHPATDALLEIAAVFIDMDSDGSLKRGATHNFHVQPFEGGRLDPTSLSITGIDPFHPLRPALPERDALQRVFRELRPALRASGRRRASRRGARSRRAAAGGGVSAAPLGLSSARGWLQSAGAWPSAPASARSFFSSPLWYIWSAMSQPPISSPLTYSCG